MTTLLINLEPDRLSEKQLSQVQAAAPDMEVRLTRDGLLRVDQLLPVFYAPEYRNARYT